jgi:hypothetical protein
MRLEKFRSKCKICEYVPYWNPGAWAQEWNICLNASHKYTPSDNLEFLEYKYNESLTTI